MVEEEKRQVFYSFDYDKDVWRVQEIRNMGVVEGNEPVSANEWEKIKQKGYEYIKKWIDENLKYRSCTIVLVGEKTADSHWVRYEIEKSLDDGKGVFGIYIHNLKDQYEKQSKKGKNPLADFSNELDCYDPPYADSTKVYDYIEENLKEWVENAIEKRKSI